MACLPGLKAQAQTEPEGAGTVNSPYLIGSADELRWFANHVNTRGEDGTYLYASASATLTADIDLNPGFTFNENGIQSGPEGEEPYVWTPIINSINNKSTQKYSGIFDGNGYSISGLYIKEPDNNNIGLFGNVGSTTGDYSTSGTVKNLTLTNGYIEYIPKSNGGVGAISGNLYGGCIANCRNEVYINATTGGGEIGGICGSAVFNRLTSTSNLISKCINTGTIKSSSTQAVSIGGICGLIGSNASAGIEDCANYATIILPEAGGALKKAGGIIGETYTNSTLTIENCYNTGALVVEEGTKNATYGILCGESSIARIENCYYLPQEGLSIIGSGTPAKTPDAYEKSAEEFASGEVAYLLGEAWGQTLSGTQKDALPVMRNDDNQVFYVTIYHDNTTAKEGYINKVDLLLQDNDLAFTPDEELKDVPNVVVGSAHDGTAYTCQELVLTDGKPFYTPRAFTAVEATYTRTPAHYADGQKGWETIVVPFDGVLTANGEAQAYFTSDDDNKAQYWLKTFSGQSSGNTLGFSYEQPDEATFHFLLRAGKPYIIALPGEATWPGYGFDGKKIAVVGENTTVAPMPSSIPGSSYTFVGSYDGQVSAAGPLYALDSEGLNFVQGGTAAPFRAYLTTTQVLNAPRTLGIGSGTDGTTGLHNLDADNSAMSLTPGAGYLTIRTTRATAVSVTSLQGYTLWSGTVDGTQRIDLPAAGCYLVNGTKVIITQP